MHFVDNRRFRLADLLLALAAGTLWYVGAGKLSWQPLLLALFPWMIRIRYVRFPFRRTSLDTIVFTFLVTSVIGIWSAYDRAMACSKFWIIVGAVFIFYALAGQSRPDIWISMGLMGSIGVAVSGYFLLTHDWQAWPADVEFLTQVGRWWQAIRPFFSAPKLHPNIAGGIMAVLVPFMIAFGCRVRRKRQFELVWLTVMLLSFVLFGLLMTSSRAAWLALAIAMSIWLLWVISQYASRSLKLARRAAFVLMVLVLGSLGVWLVFWRFGGVADLMASLPGPDSVTSRADLAKQTWDLVGDFPYIGGGLAAFAGLYSNYIAVIPFFLFDYSHNLFLDVLLEQGAFGFLSLGLILIGSVWLLAVPSPSRHKLLSSRKLSEVSLFRWAVFAGLVTMSLHGLIDDSFYGSLGTPLLLILPGLAVTLSGNRVGKRDDHGTPFIISRSASVKLAVAILIVGLLAYGARRKLTASWYANLGAVEMARTELTGWPTGEWADGRDIAAFDPASRLLDRALLSDPNNRTAQHRLGLIAMLKPPSGTYCNVEAGL
jgi:O-antigen ligase